MISKPFIAISAAVLILALCISAITLLSMSGRSQDIGTQTQSISADDYDTIHWKNYRDSLGYEVKYRPDWTISRAPYEWDNMLLSQEFYMYPKEIPYGPPPLLQINVTEGTFDALRNSAHSETLSEVSFNGRTAYRTPTGSPEGYVYTFEHCARLYHVIYEPSLADYGITHAEAMAALASFRIIDECSPR